MKKDQDFLAPCETSFRVYPTDIDINLHMNNGVYFSIMDLARVDLMIRTGIFGKLTKNGYYPVVASETIKFKKSLETFKKFQIKTQLESWNEKDFFVVQGFYVKGELYAEGVLRARFKQKGRKGSVPTKEIFDIGQKQAPLTQMSKRAELQLEMETHLVP